MIFLWLARLVTLVHLAFIVFVVAGGWLVWRWPRLAWLHVPAVAWGAWIELTGRLCPLTPLENRLRALAGADGYAGDFVDHYLVSLIYPPGLTRETQIALGIVVIVINVAVYWVVVRMHRHRSAPRW